MRSSVTLLLLVVLAASSVYAQPTVFYDKNTDSLCNANEQLDGVYAWPVEHYFAIYNPDNGQTSFRCVFHIWTATGSTMYISQTRFYNGFDTLFGVTPAVYVEGSGSDYTVTVDAGPASSGPGWPAGPDTVRFFGIEIWVNMISASSEFLLFDSTSSSSYGDWSASPGPSIGWIPFRNNPGLDVPWVVDVFRYPDLDPVSLDCGSVVGPFTTTHFCDEMHIQFWGGGPIWGNASYIYNIWDGPGVIDSFTGVWTWTPSAADAGQDITLNVNLQYKFCDPYGLGPWDNESSWCETTLHPGPNAPPSFANSQETEVTVSGQPLTMQCAVNDADPCTDYTYSYFVPAGEPSPPIQLDPVTGEMTYPANPDDTNTYNFSLVVTEGQFADTTEITLYHWDSPLCGDMNHDGSSDISDLTWVVAYSFKSGISPSPPEAGNVNCLAGIDISDITYLVKYMFASGPDPCACK